MAFLAGPVNFVNFIMKSNCQRPLYIYVTTAIPCFVEAIIMLRLWDFGDMVRATGTAAAGGKGFPRRGKPHTQTRRGKQPPGSGRDRAYRNGLKTLLAITQPLEHIGFALLLYGVIDKFYADWMMYLDDADACLDPGFAGPFIRRQTNGDAHPSGTGNTVQLPELIANNAGWSSNTVTVALPVGRYKAVFACTVTGPGGGADYHVELRATGVIGTGTFKGDSVSTMEGVDSDLMVDADIFIASPTGGNLQWIIVGPQVPVGLRVPQADVFVMRQKTAF